MAISVTHFTQKALRVFNKWCWGSHCTDRVNLCQIDCFTPARLLQSPLTWVWVSLDVDLEEEDHQQDRDSLSHDHHEMLSPRHATHDWHSTARWGGPTVCWCSSNTREISDPTQYRDCQSVPSNHYPLVVLLNSSPGKVIMWPEVSSQLGQKLCFSLAIWKCKYCR